MLFGTWKLQIKAWIFVTSPLPKEAKIIFWLATASKKIVSFTTTWNGQQLSTDKLHKFLTIIDYEKKNI